MPASDYRQSRAFLLAILLLIATVSWMSFGMEIAGTGAYFSDTETFSGNTFTAGNFDPLMLYPGKSKETHVNKTGPFELIARIVDGEFLLDFGEVAAGNGNNSP
ncbi:MAG: SipW-dependent-type signal peptide-containing protein, partial [Thermoleophilia bacterium]